MDFSVIKNFAGSMFQKVKTLSPKQVAILIVAAVAVFFAMSSFAYTEIADGSIMLTPQDVEKIEARFAAVIQAAQEMADRVDEDTAVIEKLKKQIEVGPNKTCL